MIRLNLFLLAVLIVCALSLVTSRYQARKLFVELEREQSQSRAYEVEYGQLQIEQSTWAMPGRVEKIARERGRMQLAPGSRIEIVETPQNGTAGMSADALAARAAAARVGGPS